METGNSSEATLGKRQPTVRARPYSADTDRGSRLENILTPAEQAELTGIATVLDYPKAHITLYSEGDEARSLYAIDAGLIKISRHVMDGDRHVLGFLRPGDLCGLAEHGHYINTVETLTPATVFCFPLQKLERLLMRDSLLQLHLLIKAAHELRTAQRQIIILGKQDTHRRLAAFLLEFCQHHDFFDAARDVLTLPMTRFDIADYIGTAPETVARAFAKLEQEGLVVRASPKLVEIRDMAGLIRLVSGRAA